MYLSCSYSWRLIYLAACLNCYLELLQSIWSALTRFLVECRHPNSLIGWNSLSICRIPSSSPRLLLLAYWENEILEVNAAVDELSSDWCRSKSSQSRDACQLPPPTLTLFGSDIHHILLFSLMDLKDPLSSWKCIANISIICIFCNLFPYLRTNGAYKTFTFFLLAEVPSHQLLFHSLRHTKDRHLSGLKNVFVENLTIVVQQKITLREFSKKRLLPKS